jgi:hypothetical protein
LAYWLQGNIVNKKIDARTACPAATGKHHCACYNEEVTAIATIQSLLKTEYPDFEIIFVDDGSKDKTFEVVTEAYGNHPLVRY